MMHRALTLFKAMPDIRECISRREDAGEDASVSYSGDGIYKVRA